MKYMLLTYLNEKEWADLGEAEQQRLMSQCAPHVQDLLAKKKIVSGAPLHPTSMTTTVRARNGKRMITDGPFAETREQLAGYSILEANDLDEAIAIAAGFLGTDSMSTIEVRPIDERFMVNLG